MNSIDKKFSIDEAVKIISDEASKKFVEAIDVAVNLGIDPVKTDQAVRGATNLPHGNGKTYKVAVFAEGDEAQEAKKTGAPHNLGAILFFLPGYGITLKNIDEATKAAKERALHLNKLKEKKDC